ncbi:putative cytosol aminopeptidase [Alphaproteobacteria bacterium]|nr:putative cytosol aminopeptidase [Alphaproteobacteria bacterium]
MVIQDISFVDSFVEGSSVVVGVYDDCSLSKNASSMDETLGGEVEKNVKKSGFSGKIFETTSFISSTENCNYVVIVGLGEPGRSFSNYELEKLGATAYSAAKKLDTKAVIAIDDDDISSESSPAQLLVAFGSLQKSWDFDKYKTDKKDSAKLESLSFITADVEDRKSNFEKYKNIADAIFLTRTVVSEPANVIYPESLSEIALKELLPLGVDVEILDKQAMTCIGMNALLGVGQGSEKEPKLAILRWNGAEDESAKPLAFVGKGVTFDSGGISLKPGDDMHEMRYDMAGSGTVLGLLKAVALNKLPVNVVGIMAMVENMPSGTAQRPGDIVKSLSGQTIEVLNTDAEGRLILADALWYTQNRFSPEIMIDLATLTGAIIVALGHEFAGLFSNDDELAEKIKASADSTGEKVWRMPLTDHFDKGINSDIADMQNIAKPSVRGGSITAAHFLKRFVNDVKWAHIDIAGVEVTSDDDVFICSKGATGFGVHLLYDFISSNYTS